MSLWDTYCKLVDRRCTRYGDDPEGFAESAVRDIAKAAHFMFDEKTEVFDSVEGERWRRLQFDAETLFLPFETCAVEFRFEHGSIHPVADPRNAGAILCLFGRPEGHEVGFGTGETRWPVMTAAQSPDEPGVLRINKVVVWGPYIPGNVVNVGQSEDNWTSGKVMSHLYSVCDYDIRTGKCRHAWKDGEPTSGIDKEGLTGAWKTATAFALHAFGLIQTANSPANWVVRVTDEHARVVKRRGKKVEEKRSRLIVVPDRELDRVIRSPSVGSDFIEKAPHRRRAHFRRLLSPRFRLKRGQRVFIKESWIGPKEATHGGEHYEVLTSLPSTSEGDAA